MTDQKIEEIRARANKTASWLEGMSNKSADSTTTDDIAALIRDMQTELDRMKAELAEIDEERVANKNAHDMWQRDAIGKAAEIATLKASGTFSDGVEAAAKAVDDSVATYKNDPNDYTPATVLHCASAAIRALTPEPRPDAQAQRERELELIAFVQWHEKNGIPAFTREQILGAYEMLLHETDDEPRGKP